MIQAKFYRAGDDSLHMVLLGHAGFAPKGEDLVCAGASTLVCTLGTAAERLYEQGMLRRYPRVQITPGRAEIILLPKKEYEVQILLLCWMAELGMGILEEHYPQCVRVEETLRMEKQE